MLPLPAKEGKPVKVKAKNCPGKKAVTLYRLGASISTGSLRKAPAGVSSKGYPPVRRSEIGSPGGIFRLAHRFVC